MFDLELLIFAKSKDLFQMAISQKLILPLTKVGQNCIRVKVLCFSSLFATKRRGGTRRGIIS